MHSSTSFIRTLFLLLSLLFFTAFNLASSRSDDVVSGLLLGLVEGTVFASVLFLLESRFKSFNLRSFNLAALGLLFGMLMAFVLTSLFSAIEAIAHFESTSNISGVIKIGLVLFSAYFGMILTSKAADEISFSIPFIKFKANQQKKKDILLDASTLSDPRLIDLANSGLLDNQLVIPQYAIQELQAQSESSDDALRFKSKKSLEALKKLQNNPALELRTIEKDPPEVSESHLKLVSIARQIDANILTADLSKIQQSEMEGLKVININFLSQVLKPVASAGEHLLIKVLRYGKEPRQGVGYLDDGTMVVINGGAEFMGQTIKALVLSVKSTPAGRMIFCNATENGEPYLENYLQSPRDLESSSL